MKKIGIDARLYSQTGVGVYVRNLIHYLQELDLSGITFYIYHLSEDKEKIFAPTRNFIKKPADFRWHSIAEQTGFLRALKDDNLDLMHFTYFGYPVLYKGPFIATIHDTTPLMFKTGKASTKNPVVYAVKHFVFKHVLFSQIANSQAVITPTLAVKKEILKIYGDQYDKKIYPIHEGIDYRLLEIKENKKLSKQFPGTFFIYVGNFYPHKNIEKLIRAFSKIITKNKLILIGPRDFFSNRLRELIIKLKQDRRIVFYHGATYADLVFFYRHAQALIHPSLSEGFGLPLVEAAYFRCPIIASNIPAFREVLGNGYQQFDPHNENDIVEKITTFLKKRRVSGVFSKGVNKLSFETMAERTLSLYKNL